MVKRAILAVLAALLSLAVIVGAEVVFALRRDYLPTEPALEITGVFGPPTDDRSGSSCSEIPRPRG